MGMLDGRVAICTGAGRGVGGEVAKLMAAHGAKVVVNDPGTSGSGEGHDETPAQQIVNEIKSKGGEAVANTAPSPASMIVCRWSPRRARPSAACTSYSTPPASCGTRCSTICSPRIGRQLSTCI